jgi:basic membrane protein A and related proteins
VQDTIRKSVVKSFKGGYQEFGIQENGVGYADNEYNREMIAPFKPKLEEIKTKIQAGEIKVPVTRRELK